MFTGRSPVETMMMHVHSAPDPPSLRTDRPLPREIILLCLTKDPEGRPQSADQLAEMLAGVPTAGGWTPADAREWWDNHRPPAIARYPHSRGQDSNG